MAGRVPAILGTAPPPAPPARGTATPGSAAPPPFWAPPTEALNTVLATHGIPGSTMGLGVFFILGLLVLRAELGPTPETGGQPQKPGRCPRDFTRCLRLQPPLCANDSGCPGWHKCCPRDCRLRCIPPAEEKPGACPAAAPEGLFVPCSFPCLEDKDCVGAQKCCPLSCGPACLEPVRAEDTPAIPGCPRGLSTPPASATSTPTLAPTAVTQRVPDSSAGSPNTEGTPTATPAWQEGTRCRSDGDCGDGEMCCDGRCAELCIAERQAKPGFCPVRAGLFPSYDCRSRCWHDFECPGEQKCCLSGCDYVCLPPAPEKPGICPLLTEEPLATVAPCGPSCTGDGQCPGAHKCCRTRCGHICVAPEPDKPGVCPKVKPLQPPEPCTEQDSCVHDRDCPRQEKCCFSGCAMRCARPAREHPGECPPAEPCWDPRRRRGSRCLDDSVCQHEEKCCGTGCGWDCVPVPRERWDGAGGRCTEECEADAQCPWGQRCTSTGCGRVCMDIPGAGCSPCRQSGSVSRHQGGGDLPGPLQPGRGVSLGPQVLQQRLWTRLHTRLSAGA
ncbi:progranulin-like isoform X4 [Calypte anna]|uniref:progranulin-like isoform X4 n=1 Tax=Calypte anna TaxID=9244 RepID=UPI0011C3C47B|nr:progranulin-like isoform X4 [Calypte anna]